MKWVYVLWWFIYVQEKLHRGHHGPLCVVLRGDYVDQHVVLRVHDHLLHPLPLLAPAPPDRRACGHLGQSGHEWVSVISQCSRPHEISGSSSITDRGRAVLCWFLCCIRQSGKRCILLLTELRREVKIYDHWSLTKEVLYSCLSHQANWLFSTPI